jgi:hypothetical protein
MQEICSYGSVGEPSGDWRLYPERRGRQENRPVNQARDLGSIG